MKDQKKLEDRIEELEDIIRQKDAELKVFKKELVHLNGQIEDLISKLKKQIQTAVKIQGKLVPTEFPNIPGFEFSTKFESSLVAGGDYFDIFEIEDRFRFSLLLSSCTGYGISSLFLSVLLKLTSHIETKKGAPPEKVLAMVIKELVPQITEQDSANIFYALINRRNYEMTYAHYGFNLALLYQDQEKNIIELESSGPAIGIQTKGKTHAHTIHLNPKDCLVIVSDGVFKVKNSRGTFFDKSRIKKIMLEYSQKNPHELRNEIFFQIHKWSGSKDLEKDITVMVAEVKDRVLKLAR